MSYLAVSILGCSVARDKIYKMQKQRLCRAVHKTEEPDYYNTDGCLLEERIQDYSDFKLCPFCTSDIYKTMEVRIDKGAGFITVPLDDEDVRIDVLSSDLLNNAGTYYFVGQMLGKVAGDAQRPFEMNTAYNERVKSLKAALEKLELWRDHAFGVYTVLMKRDND